MKKKISILVIVGVLVLGVLGGCRQSDKVSHNISLEADNFNVIRRFTVINAMSDEPVFELVGAFSYETYDNRIEITVETGKDNYKKHSVALTEFTIWNVEDLYGADVDRYKYIVNFQPESIVPMTIENLD
ncbi:hypothetical protein [Senegalia massiliensis]|uniref:Uncharacterized protein n=1 Tax=Senegalia massiliensis TaxID=1720316 RepID=A0A845R480_9CLOT|nr:hypothetical protein [Senegalia massiliensis]NBI08222.1 hypothetical protein [Senegalia massiliensis]